jgi:hypothetical protein
MAQLKVTWNDGSKEELIESIDMSADEYKTMRFGTPASEVTVVEVVTKKSSKKAAAEEPAAE